jgi:hypothetical protein
MFSVHADVTIHFQGGPSRIKIFATGKRLIQFNLVDQKIISFTRFIAKK